MYSIKTQPNLKNRIAATLIDYTLYLTSTTIYIARFGEENNGTYSVTGFMAFIPMVFWFLYFPIVESINGQTLGHKIIGIKAISKSGEPISFIQAVKRRILDFIDLFSFLGLVAIISIKNSPTNQRIGDMFASTLIVGKETGSCSHCGEKVTLDPEDTIKGKFTCPYCSKESGMEFF